MTRVDALSKNPENNGSDKTPKSIDYQNKQKELSSHIKPQAESLEDLKNAAYYKQKQIKLANEYGDTDLAKTLQTELDRINNDIHRNTSIFNS